MDTKQNLLIDQFFLTDPKIIKKIVDCAQLTKNDVVLEVGSGTGNLTREIAKKAGKVIAFEIDERFRSLLSDLPKNVELHFEDAWNYVQLHGKYYHKKDYNKVVANLPYSFVEPFLHNLTFLEYDKVILMVPVKFAYKIEQNPVFGSFFKPKVLLEVPKEKFEPVPRTNSVVIDLVKLPKPLETKNLGLFLRQYTYQHEGQLVKNSLIEGIVKFARSVSKKNLTKNEARKIVADVGINFELLNNTPGTPEIYEQVGSKFSASMV